MSWKDKTFKEKKVFYKERQKFFDAVKACNNGNDNITIKYNGEIYRLVSTNSFSEYIDNVRHGYAVIFSKAYKSNTIIVWNYGSRNGFKWYTENNNYVSGDRSKILCFAEKVIPMSDYIENKD